MKDKSTKSKILDMAEKLFAENGVQGTSLRQIISKAGVNIASVHYHFGSKEIVIQEIFRRRFEPLQRQKIETLEKLRDEVQGKPIATEKLIRAFIEPHLRMQLKNKNRSKILFRLFGELENALNKIELPPEGPFIKAFELYIEAFQETLPHLSEDEIKWRMKFMMGAMHSIFIQQSFPKWMPMRQDEFDEEQLFENLVEFSTAGFIAGQNR